ncbi:LuxR C-terminal-related transcriptional regulator [Candidatus Sodalis sp. SoCistrobi]|uniref:helix-turn-helix transcriptional regulator n=1 Tax=Candidatus Sodalis sp. SoCistrobi TaxID=1922216 RepID=UPI00093ECA43|nr:LuxR C-terminal-related transcriptional regulator [Candidatus Sodalis sp. SoCistrobi]
MTAFEPIHFLPYHKVFPELSDKELHVVVLYCTGLKNELIASVLSINIKTVGAHLYNCQLLYGLNSHSELRAMFMFRMLSFFIKFLYEK